MSDTTDPVRHLQAAAEAIRQFNHESLSTGGDNWRYPPAAYRAVGSLSHLVGMLAQAIDQSVQPVRKTHELGRVLLDDRSDPTTAVEQLENACRWAVTAAHSATRAVQKMHNITSPMGLDTTGMPEFEHDDEDGDDEPDPVYCRRCSTVLGEEEDEYEGAYCTFCAPDSAGVQ